MRNNIFFRLIGDCFDFVTVYVGYGILGLAVIFLWACFFGAPF